MISLTDGQPVEARSASRPFQVLCLLARLDEESSNALFEALEEWERHLASIGSESLRCDDEHLTP
jgi:hypothetical protein